VLAVQDVGSLCHNLGLHLRRHRSAAASDVHAALRHAGEGAVWAWLPVPALDGLQLGAEELGPGPDGGAQRGLGRELAKVPVVARAVDATLLGHDLRGRRVHVLPDHVGAAVDQRLGRGALLDRVVPASGVDHSGRGGRVGPLRAHLERVDRPVHDAERVGRDEAEMPGLRNGARDHAAKVVALVRAAVERFQVRPVRRAGAVEERDLRVGDRQVFERVGIAEGGANYDVVAAGDEPVCGGLDAGGVLRNVVDGGNFDVPRLFKLHPGLLEGLGPAAVRPRPEVDDGDLRRRAQREARRGCGFLGQPRVGSASRGKNRERGASEDDHRQAPWQGRTARPGSGEHMVDPEHVSLRIEQHGLEPIVVGAVGCLDQRGPVRDRDRDKALHLCGTVHVDVE